MNIVQTSSFPGGVTRQAVGPQAPAGAGLPLAAHPAASQLLSSPPADEVRFSGRVNNMMLDWDSNRQLKSLRNRLVQVNQYQEYLRQIPDQDFSRYCKEKTVQYRQHICTQMGVRSPEKIDVRNPSVRKKLDGVLDKLMPEAYALAREATYRVTGKFQYDVQVMAALAMNGKAVAQMKTGEGKTLASVLPVYLNALVGLGTHVVTANDYLALRDAEDNAPIFKMLGLEVGVIHPTEGFYADLDARVKDALATYKSTGQVRDTVAVDEETMKRDFKRKAYQADVTYGTHSEFGFDYLKDNIKITKPEQRVQRDFYYALIDEADSVLIDDANTPLILSGPGEVRADEQLIGLYKILAAAVSKMQGISRNQLEREIDAFIDAGHAKNRDDAEDVLREQYHYIFDEAKREVDLTEVGQKHEEERAACIPNYPKLQDLEQPVFYALLQSIKAKEMMKPEVDYLLDRETGEIQIVDASTGRVQEGRAWNDGMHYAIQAKESGHGQQVHITPEMNVEASITYQSYFRLYPRLCGMTGTAKPSANELSKVYGLRWVKIPTNAEESTGSPCKIEQWPDVIARSRKEKFKLVADEIVSIRKNAAPLAYKQHENGDPAASPAEQPTGLARDIWSRRPILVGTGSIRDSEALARVIRDELKEAFGEEAVNHPVQVLNAKNASKENEIISHAGRPGAITIATNMAGRGTDIQLGKLDELAEEILGEVAEQELKRRFNSTWENTDAELFAKARTKQIAKLKSEMLTTLAEEALEQKSMMTPENTDPREYARARIEHMRALESDTSDNYVTRYLRRHFQRYGLYVIGTERFHSRRVDDQLAGRAGRQGDPGFYRFFSSPDDKLYQDNLKKKVIQKLIKTAPAQSPNIEKKLNLIQEEAELESTKSRVDMLKYDLVVDDYRKKIYGERQNLLTVKTWNDLETYLQTQFDDAFSHALPCLFAMSESLNELFEGPAPQNDAEELARREDFKALMKGKNYGPQTMAADREIPLNLLYTLCSETDLLQRIEAAEQPHGMSEAKVCQKLAVQLRKTYLGHIETLLKQLPAEKRKDFTILLLTSIDESWKVFLDEVTDLKATVNWRIMGQQVKPEIFYRLQSHEMFNNMRVGLLANILEATNLIQTQVELSKKQADPKKEAG